MDDETRQRLDDLEARCRRHEVAWEFWTPHLLRWEEYEWKGRVEMIATICHTIAIVALIASATIITVLHGDATPVWAALAGYVGGGIVQKATTGKAT